MKIIGKTTINPVLFYTGKISGYVAWILYALSILNLYKIEVQNNATVEKIAVFQSIVGLVIVSVSLINLGSSTRLGLPSEKTILKSTGIYKFSRNPMYLGFNILTMSSIMYLGNIFVGAMGLYSIIVYHLIIKGEENFLEQRFGKVFVDYKSKVRRYI